MKCLSLMLLAGLLLLPMLTSAEEALPRGPEIVGNIVKVEMTIEEIAPPNLVVTATGEVPSAGFTMPQLNRVVYVKPPVDGIQDYFLTAVPPDGPAATVISKVSAKDTWKGYTKDAAWLKGVRVHGVGKGVMVKMLDGSKKE
jgi:hypothetical protein